MDGFGLFDSSSGSDSDSDNEPAYSALPIPPPTALEFDAAYEHVHRVVHGHLEPLCTALSDRGEDAACAAYGEAYAALARHDSGGCIEIATWLAASAWDRLQTFAKRLSGSTPDGASSATGDGDEDEDERLIWRDLYIISQDMVALCSLEPRSVTDESARAALAATDRAFMLGGAVSLTQQLAALAAKSLPALDAVQSAPSVDSVESAAAKSSAAGTLIPTCDAALSADAPAIARCAAPPLSVKDFEAHYFLLKLPVVLEGATAAWSAASRVSGWRDVECFRRAFGHRTVPIEIGRHHEDSSWNEELVTIGEFVERYLIPSNARGVVPLELDHAQLREVGYLAQHALFDQLPGLREDYIVPPYCAALGELSNINAWIGTGGTVSPLHYDTYDNFLTQVAGTKYVRLYAEAESSKLYPGGGEESQGNISRVDVERPDGDAFPLFQGALYTETYLKEGDALFIPKGTWHYVRSLTTSISVNFWF